MTLSAGTKLGLYEVVGALGSGGMGEVYRARDTKLGRAVAIKVLPEPLASDPDRITRFEREARILASLNHPHIASLHGMEESSGRHFLVMELVEGETLAERLQRGPMSVEDALNVAHQIAEALEAAHEKGIVHRDLKPANVKITPDDKVKVLDFGLAKLGAGGPEGAAGAGEAGGSGSAGRNLTHSPTLSMMATEAGVILGTAAYMSPEQAKGLNADHRSDVFAFGVVLYEMLTGRQPFKGETAPDVLASVLVRDADLQMLPTNVNPRLHELLRRCLDKNPKRRWQAVGDLRAEIETIAADPRGAALPLGAPRPLWRRVMPVLSTAIVVAALTAVATWNLKSTASPIVARFLVTLPDDQQFTNAGRHLIALSPDGSELVYVANSRLNRRLMSDVEAKPIPGAENPLGVLNPVYSPDGRSIAFHSGADRTLKRIAVTGGAVLTICAMEAPFGIGWTQDGWIIFGQSGKGIVRVRAGGGEPEVLVAVKGDEVAQGPQMLPDGDTVMFALSSGIGPDRWDRARIVAQSLKSHDRKTLIEGGSDARYLPTGHIVYAGGGTLFAVPFDLRRLTVTGAAVPVIEGVRRAGYSGSGAAHFSVSDTGSLAFIPGPTGPSSNQASFAFIDRSGTVEPLKLPSGPYDAPRLSPDGKRMVFFSDDGKEAIVWIYEVSGTTAMRKLTFGGRNRFPIWSADGQHVVFQSDREGDLGIFWQRADGTGTAERLTKPERDGAHVPESWSPKSDTFLFRIRKGSEFSLASFSMADRKATRFADVESINPFNSMFSPDGRWVAYTVYSLPGINTMFLQPFPPTGAKYQIQAGTIHPLWSPDGKQIFSTPRGRFAAVNVTTEPTVTFSDPVPMARGAFYDAGPGAPRPYDITPDGKRFLSLVRAEQAGGGAPQIHVVLNWFEELKQRVAATRQ